MRKQPPQRSYQKRKTPESPMEWSKCPVCGEPFSEQHPSPIPGKRDYIHNNGTRHTADEPVSQPQPKPATIQQTAQQTSINKKAELDTLYGRITKEAEAMGGSASHSSSSLSVPGAMTATPQSENAPSLHVKMPNGFQVDFAPVNPLSIGNALSVRAIRTTGGHRKSDHTFVFLQGGWRMSNNALSADEIRACLTPEGPFPA